MRAPFFEIPLRFPYISNCELFVHSCPATFVQFFVFVEKPNSMIRVERDLHSPKRIGLPSTCVEPGFEVLKASGPFNGNLWFHADRRVPLLLQPPPLFNWRDRCRSTSTTSTSHERGRLRHMRSGRRSTERAVGGQGGRRCQRSTAGLNSTEHLFPLSFAARQEWVGGWIGVPLQRFVPK